VAGSIAARPFANTLGRLPTASAWWVIKGKAGFVAEWKAGIDCQITRYPSYRFHIWDDAEFFQVDAIDDLGADIPKQTVATIIRYDRDPAVRDAVLKRANGRCEYCCKLGFLRADGSHYLESHHIIALAKEGEDRLSNVIALCPEHHREAHFGVRSAELEQEMIAKVRSFLG
jgi:hypothetical protein